MSNMRGFHFVIAKLMKQYQINAAKAAENGHDVYIITLENGMQVFLLGNQPEYLNILSPAATFTEVETIPHHVLLSLLSMNMWNTKHPVFNIGFDIHKMQIMLSCRQALAELDQSETYQLVGTFINTALKLKEWIDQQIETISAKK